MQNINVEYAGALRKKLGLLLFAEQSSRHAHHESFLVVCVYVHNTTGADRNQPIHVCIPSLAHSVGQ